jgi:hypothetical protein
MLSTVETIPQVSMARCKVQWCPLHVALCVHVGLVTQQLHESESLPGRQADFIWPSAVDRFGEFTNSSEIPDGLCIV